MAGRGRAPLPLEDRFWAKVRKTPTCWLWLGKPSTYGYGRITLDGKRVVGAHVASWLLHQGPIPGGLVILHRCDTPACVRPDHLFMATQGENLRDMWEKRRARPQGRMPLSREQIAALRADRLSGMSYGTLMAKYRLSKTHVGRLCAVVPAPVVVDRQDARGEAHHNAKLTAADIPVIRARLASGASVRAVARDYGVSSSTVFDIKRGHIWRHVS